jgi:translocation and assembly module TamB
MWRWSKRIMLGLVVLVVLVTAGVIAFVHTDYGREAIRAQLEAQLDAKVVGGARIGSLEGSPFGELVIRDLVLNGPDGRPAITVGVARARLKLFDLVHSAVRIEHLLAEDVDVRIGRDLAGLLRPSEKPTTWDVVLSSLEVKRARIAIETADPELGTVHLDDVELLGALTLPAHGVSIANLAVDGRWRERDVPVSASLALRADLEVVAVERLNVTAGKVTVTGTQLALQRRGDAAPRVTGTMNVVAKRVDVMALEPRVRLPADVELSVRATAQPAQTFDVTGTLGPTPIVVHATADLDAQRLAGTLLTGSFELAPLTEGTVDANASVAGAFEATRVPGEALPRATVRLAGHGRYANVPRSAFRAYVETRGGHISTAVDVAGAASVELRAELERFNEVLVVERATLVAKTSSPARTSGRRIALRGALAAELKAHGTLLPTPDLAVTGTVRGEKLRMNELSIGSIDVRANAARIPASPTGAVSVRVAELRSGDTRLALAELDAVLRSSVRGDLVVNVQRHLIRAANGMDWRGTRGRIVIAPREITVRDLRSHGSGGALAIAGSFTRAGRNAGDASATIDLERFALATVRADLRGTLNARVDVRRRSAQWTGGAKLSALIATKAPEPLALDATLAVAPRSVHVEARATTTLAGCASVVADVRPPAKLEDVAAWKRLGRDAIERVRIRVDKVDLGRLTGAGAPDAKVGGTLDGQLELRAHTAAGELRLSRATAPALRGIRAVEGSLVLTASGPDQLHPTVRVIAAEVGTAVATAQLRVPERVFDPAAWRRLGRDAIVGAAVRTDEIVVDPAMLARLGMTSTMRGRAKLDIEVAEGMRAIKVAARARELRGTPLAKPVDLQINATIDDQAARAMIAMTSEGAKTTLLNVEGHVPITLAQLDDALAAPRALPVSGTVHIPSASAPDLMSVFGRSEVVGGTLDGEATLSGTLGNPTLVAKLVGRDLAVLPLHGRRSPVVKQATIDATWSDAGAKLVVDATQDSGGTLALRAKGEPADLARATARVDAKGFDLRPLLAFFPGPAGGVQGRLDAALTVRGFDPRTAILRGELHLRSARVPLAPSIGTLRRAQIDVEIRDRELVVGAEGRLGAGTAKLAGTIALDGAALTGGTAKLTLRKVSPIGAVEPVIDADVTAILKRTAAQWKADVVVDNGVVTLGKRSGEKLEPVGLPRDLTIGPRATTPERTEAAPAPPARPAISATVTLRPIRVVSKELRTTVQGKVTATADADSVGVIGTIEAKSGDIDLFDRRYRIERAAVIFDGTIDPRLDVRITHDFPEVTTITVVRDRLSKPELELASNPGGYTNSQLLGFLLGGEPNGDPTSGSARDKAVSTGTSVVANLIGGYVRSALPFDIDVLRYEAATAGSSSAITVGTWLTRALFFAYRQHLGARPDENSGEATLEYWVTQQLKIQGTAGNRGYDGADVLWRKSF